MKFVKLALKKLLVLAMIGTVLYAVVTVALWLISKDKPVGVPYRTAEITRGTIAELVTASGAISPEEVVTIGTQVSGQITAIYVKLNDEVKAGQLLAEIDPSIALTQLKQSKASLETAQLSHSLAVKDYERTKTLVAKDYVAKVEEERAWQNVVSSKNSLESAKITVERDEVNLGYTKVTSPIDGIIIFQDAASGQTVASNFQTPNLFKIAKDLTRMKIDMSVPEADISKIHEGMPVKFTVDAFEDRVFDGVVNVIDLNPNNQSGVVTYNVVVILENRDRALFPGMTANISITLAETKDILRVPATALRFTPPVEYTSPLQRLFTGGSSRSKPVEKTNELRIYLWKNNQLVSTPIDVGVSDDLYFQVTSDNVKEGDTVVTGMQFREEE